MENNSKKDGICISVTDEIKMLWEDTCAYYNATPEQAFHKLVLIENFRLQMQGVEEARLEAERGLGMIELRMEYLEKETKKHRQKIK